MNPGKQFEKDFQSSAVEIEIERLKDSGGWGDSENKRFSPSNIADFVLYDGESEKKELFYVELKSFKGKSIPFTNFNIEHLKKLIKKTNKQGVRSIIVLNPRDIEEAYFVDCEKAMEYMINEKTSGGRKSFSIDWITQQHQIPGIKKQVHFKYDLKSITRG